MQVPLEITFRHMDPSEAMENRVRESARKLDRFYEHIMSCRVVVEADHRHHHKGNLYHVRVDITVPDGELVASREPHRHHSHEDAYVAIRDAFSAAVRQLEDYSRKRQQHVKRHQVPPHGWVSELHPDGDYGRIATADGRDVYFHRNSVLGEGFDALEVGSEVRADIEEGDEGLQASTVRLIGKHHLAG
jgi:ribosomal subunit interface protein